MEATKRRYRAWMAIVVGHLVLVLLGASYIDLGSVPAVGKVLGYYGVLSGAGNSYGFFAPGVSGQLRAQFEITDAHGKKKMVPLTTWGSHEAQLRVGNIIDQYAVDDEDDADDSDSDSDDGSAGTDLHRSLAASLAGTVFGSHPEARSVTVKFDELIPVSMAEYRQGERADWSPLYQATFVHHLTTEARR